MTYSRPGTRQVDALQRVAQPMDVGIKGSSRVQVSGHGRIYDNRNPNTILANAEKQNQAIGKFLDTLVSTGATLYKEKLMEDGRRQAGELLATQNPVELMRAASPEERDKLRGLNPFARDIINQAAASGAASDYIERYSAGLASKQAILTDPNASDAAKAAALSSARGDAIEKSGLNKVDPSSLAALAPQLASQEGGLRGVYYKGQVTRQREDDRSKTVNGFSSLIEKLDVELSSVEVVTEADASRLRKWWESTINGHAAAWTSQEVAQMLYDATASQMMSLIASGREGEAFSRVDLMVGQANLGVKTASGADFFDIQLSSGKTLRTALGQLSDQALARKRQADVRNAREGVRDLTLRAMNGEDVRAEFLAATSTMPTEALLELASEFSSATKFGQSPTAGQLQAAAELMYDSNATGADRGVMAQRWREAYNAGNITIGQFAQGLTSLKDGGDEITRSVANARTYLSGEIGIAADDVAGAIGLEDSRGMNREIAVDASKNVEKRAREAAQAGKPWSSEIFVQELRNEVETLRNAKVRQYREGVRGAGPNANQRTVNEVEQFRRNLVESGGSVTIQSFPEEVRKGAVKYYGKDNLSPKELLKYMSQRMKAATENGKPLFSDPEKILKDFIRNPRVQVQKKQTSTSSVPQSDAMLSPIGQSIQRAIQTVPGLGAKGGGDKQAAAKPKPPDLISVATGGLGAIANVLIPPASAAEGKQNIRLRNPDAVKRLALAYSGKVPVSINTEPLPQVDPGAPTASVSLSINSVNHPYFVAIGIAEGTRTPKGGFTRAYYGHTDPGDGFANRGTVSGGRGMGGASPQQVDRIWMGKLTRQAVNAAPILQRMGLRPGTQGWHRAMFNILDLTVQAPAAVPDFMGKLGRLGSNGLTVEGIAKARADSFINPRTGRLDAGGFGNSYSRLLSDQRSRAGAYDYKRRL